MLIWSSLRSMCYTILCGPWVGPTIIVSFSAELRNGQYIPSTCFKLLSIFSGRNLFACGTISFFLFFFCFWELERCHRKFETDSIIIIRRLCVLEKRKQKGHGIYVFPALSMVYIFGRFVQFQTNEYSRHNKKNEYSSGEIKNDILIEFVSFNTFYKMFDF